MVGTSGLGNPGYGEHGEDLGYKGNKGIRKLGVRLAWGQRGIQWQGMGREEGGVLPVMLGPTEQRYVTPQLHGLV